MPALTVVLRYQNEAVFTAIKVFWPHKIYRISTIPYSRALALNFLHSLILGTYVHRASLGVILQFLRQSIYSNPPHRWWR